jgi:hypothetical protein
MDSLTGRDMDYETLDTKRLQKLVDDLRYDSIHKLEEAKRQQARDELLKVEAELKNRQRMRGFIRGIKKMLNIS